MSKVEFYKIYKREEIFKGIDYFLSKGYCYEDISSETKDITDVIVRTPSENVLKLDECLEILKGKLEFGNSKQIEAIKSLELLNLLYHSYFPYLNLDKLKNRKLFITYF
jgi:hypothetical protein